MDSNVDKLLCYKHETNLQKLIIMIAHTFCDQHPANCIIKSNFGNMHIKVRTNKSLPGVFGMQPLLVKGLERINSAIPIFGTKLLCCELRVCHRASLGLYEPLLSNSSNKPDALTAELDLEKEAHATCFGCFHKAGPHPAHFRKTRSMYQPFIGRIPSHSVPDAAKQCPLHNTHLPSPHDDHCCP